MEKREDSSANVYLNGLGLGSIAAAMYLIQKADFNPSNIHIFEQKGVNFHYNTRVSDVDFKTDSAGKERWIERIHLETESGGPKPSTQVRDTDLVFLTIGSMISNSTFGAHDRPVDKPADGSQNLGGAWTLWKKIAAKQPDFGRPDQFLRDTSLSKMMTFTVSLFRRKFEWLVERQMGRQSPLPITASPWILHLHTYRQPLFPDQPRDTCVIWVTALRDNNLGTFVKKTMSECTGREILEELLGHLQFDQDELEKNEILDTSTCIPCMLPYSISQFLSRAKGDRPAVGSAGSKNFAFLGQFVEIPHGIVITTEYSVLGAIHAVKKFVKPSLVVPPKYFGQYHPRTCIAVARALVR